MTDPYATLHVSGEATATEIDERYDFLRSILDSNNFNPGSTEAHHANEILKQLTTAYVIVTDPTLLYDYQMRQTQPQRTIGRLRTHRTILSTLLVLLLLGGIAWLLVNFNEHFPISNGVSYRNPARWTTVTYASTNSAVDIHKGPAASYDRTHYVSTASLLNIKTFVRQGASGWFQMEDGMWLPESAVQNPPPALGRRSVGVNHRAVVW